MTTLTSPSLGLGLALLDRLADRNEALAGDLLEEYRSRQSRIWFWRQLLTAIARGAFRQTNEFRKLKLVDFPSWLPPREDFAAKRLQLQTLGLSASPVRGISGLSIVIVIIAITLVEPYLWVMLAFGILAGILAGVLRVAFGRRHRIGPKSDLTTLVLLNREPR